ncbi:MAG: Nitrogen fixation regulation protein FixK [Firmicutes bacterium ADurb.Bin080]|jgi:CRP/FNR family transcriptional regulator, dissimilatory nitrate respiration regulator|nr:Crp/Fnr family transcriptional regulator [Clostridiales bacterium]OQC15517.1 MAG: Nitrogen fixation regulation protein FixK [Firmicutes bacterium ADurb.Bin080]
MKNLPEALALSPLFEGITEKDILPLLSCLTFKEREFSPGETILAEGERVDSVGLVISGGAHISMNDFWGNRSIVADLGPGDIFGEVYALSGGTNLSGVEVVAYQSSEILFLNFKRMITVCSSACDFHNRLISNLLKIVGEKNLMITEKMRCLTKRSTREKLLSYFSLESKKQGKNQISIPFNRQELADYLSVDRSAMSAELSRMKEEGIIDYRKNSFVLKLHHDQ